MVANVRAFIYENRGIEFYRDNPLLIVACLMLALAAGLCVNAVANHKRSRRSTESRGKTARRETEPSSGDKKDSRY
jgi:hypothetical protein